MRSDDEHFLGLDNDNGVMPLDELQNLAGTTQELVGNSQKQQEDKGQKEKEKQEEAKPKFVPKVAKTVEPEVKTQTVTQAKDEVRILNDRIRDMEAAIKLLIQGRDGIKLKAAQVERKPLDWANIKEGSIFDMDVPIDVIDHSMPDYMNVTCKDSNYVIRWVQKMPRRLGPMKAMGYQYCTTSDIEGELNIALEPDENNHIKFDDVILMKIEKRIYYGMLRRNHLRALQMVDPKAAHKTAQQRVITDLRSTEDGAHEYDERADKNQIDVYAPGFTI